MRRIKVRIASHSLGFRTFSFTQHDNFFCFFAILVISKRSVLLFIIQAKSPVIIVRSKNYCLWDPLSLIKQRQVLLRLKIVFIALLIFIFR